MASNIITVTLQIFTVFTARGLADCPDGYEGHLDFCYKLLPVKASWAEAMRYCEAGGGSLAIIKDDTENNFVRGLMARNHALITTHLVWIGGTDLLQEGTWVAPNSLEPLTYFHWGPGEPDNLQGQHCLAIFNTGPSYSWDDDTCETLNNPLCKRPRTVGSNTIIG